ncbi:hypothetical protein Celaphus_00003978 [Cervus elaphus hippelaphus]|uniref:Uncharacterized protein n=1 Tax=Cervus elaphus hippelaphus TaxID=46360 RepID=A0A212DBV0_CEREH|nr:hypothetical protein Celaphus_00003978 [Cervus elaphus hippelaphus]
MAVTLSHTVAWNASSSTQKQYSRGPRAAEALQKMAKLVRMVPSSGATVQKKQLASETPSTVPPQSSLCKRWPQCKEPVEAPKRGSCKHLQGPKSRAGAIT